MILMITKEKQRYFVETLLEISVIGFIVLYPFSTWWCNGAILAICLFGLLSSSLKEKIEIFVSSPGLYFMVLYSLVVLCGMLYSEDKRTAFDFTERTVAFLILPLLFGTAKFTPRLHRIFSVWSLTTVAAAIYCVGRNVRFFLDNKIDFKYFFYWEYNYDHLSGFIDLHPTYFSILLLISVLALIFYSDWPRPIRTLCVIFLSLFQIMLGSKIGIILLFSILNIVAIVFLVRLSKKRLLALYVVINIIILVALYNTPIVYWRFRMAFESALQMTKDKHGTDYRLLHWMCAQRVINDSPIFGVGTGDSFNELNKCYVDLDKKELLDYNAHNQFLESWVKSGVIGLIMVFFVLAIPYRASIVSHNYFFTCVFLIFLAVSLVESVFQVQKGIAMFCFLSSLFQGPLLKGSSPTIKFQSF